MEDCTYVLLAGLPGTGKSTLAAAVAYRLGRSVILNKDGVRAVLFPGDATDYSDAQNLVCMNAILAAAAYLRSRYNFIFFDGRTFSQTAHLEQIIQAAEDAQASWRILYLWCADEVATLRLVTGRTGHPAANRDAALYFSLKQHFQEIERLCLSVDTERPLKACVEDCLAYLTGPS